MFQKKRSDSAVLFWSRSGIRRLLGCIGTDVSETGRSIGLATVQFCVLMAVLLLAGPSGTILQQACAKAGEPVPDYNDPGASAQAIARFDVVPYQVFSDSFEIGVVAFHINGIHKVSFEYETQDGLQTVDSTAMTLNPRTGVCEYWIILNASDFTDGAVSVKATVYPNNGIERELNLELYANSSNSYGGKKSILYVSFNGSDDTGEGSQARPFQSIKRAFMAIAENVSRYDGGQIVLMDPGFYDMQGPGLTAENSRWITIHPEKGLHRDEVVIAPVVRENIRTRIRRLRFANLTMDFSKIGQIYKEDVHWQWYDNCRWHQSDGPTVSYPGQNWPVRNVGFNGLYVTNSVAEDMLYGFTGCNLVRGSHCSRITGDVFQMGRMVVNCTADQVDGAALEHHTDLFQWWESNENIIVYGVKAANVAGAQNFFFGGVAVSYVNVAVVNVAVQNTQGRFGPPFTQFGNTHDHVLVMHVSNPGQLSFFREDVSPPYTAHNVKFINCIFEGLSLARWGTRGLPDGVSVESCHFLRGFLQGARPSTGEISIIDGPGSSFNYEGAGVAHITGTGQSIPGFSHPNDGAAEHGAPNRGAFIFEVSEEEAEQDAAK